MPRKLYLVDGANHAYRAFFAMPRMTTSGFPTGALLGFCNMLRKLEREHEPDLLVVCFDSLAPGFRKSVFADYKGHRPDMEPELKEQWQWFGPIVEAWGLPFLVDEELEADDLMGSLATQFASDEIEVVLVTGDKDLYQLMTSEVRVYDPMKEAWIDRAAVEKKFYVGPEKVTEVLGLMGDSSDGIPGVPGIGPKTAGKLISEFGTIEAVYENLDKVTGKKRVQNLREHKDMAFLSRELATIKTDADLGLSLADLERKEQDTETLRELFFRWKFTGWLKTLEDDQKADAVEVDLSGVQLVQDVAQLRKLGAAVAGAERLGLHAILDDAGSDDRAAHLVGLAVAWSPSQAAYVSLNVLAGLGIEAVREVLGPVLSEPWVKKVCFDSKRLIANLRAIGVPVEGLAGDPLVADFLLDPDASHTIDAVSDRFLGHHPQAPPPGSDERFMGLPPEAVGPWACERALLAWLADAPIRERLDARGLAFVYDEIELPLVGVLARMESFGIGVDLEKLAGLSERFGARITELEAEIHELSGEAFNVSSPKQLGEVLFDKLGLKPKKRTAQRGRFSTDRATLLQLADEHPIAELVLEHRKLSKLKGTYVDALPGKVHPLTGRVHTHFDQLTAATGRLASSNPNLQNIPIRTPEGRLIRDCFVAGTGKVLVSCDYSQIELRLLAHCCGEGVLVDSFRNGEDIHRRTASEIYEVPLDAVTPAQRSAMKAVNFGILYGMAPPRLASDLGITVREAKKTIDAYFARYPQVRGVIDDAMGRARDTGYATTLWGRQRPVNDITSRNWQARSFAERVAVNTPIQGSAADLIKMAMIRTESRLEREIPEARMLLQVHDELVFEVAEGQREALVALVNEEMVGAAELAVPLVVAAGWGTTWDAAH